MSTKSAQKKSSWRLALTHKKVQKKVQLALLVLGLFALIILASWGVKFIRTITEPLSLKDIQKEYFWDRGFSLNLVFKGEDFHLIQVDPNEKKVKIVKLPPEVYLEVPGGFGNWQLRAVYTLGEAENPPSGARFLKATLSKLFALPVDGILEVDHKANISSKKFLESFKQNPFYFSSPSVQVRSDLSFAELLQLYLTLREVRFDKIIEYDLLALGLLGSEVAADGGLKVVADPQNLDGFVQSNLTDSKITAEAKEVNVFNTTEVAGLGQKASLLISHLGVNVTQIGTLSNEPLDKSLIIIKDGKDSTTLKRLKTVFKLCQDQKECAIIAHPIIGDSRAQIVVLLGKDFE